MKNVEMKLDGDILTIKVDVTKEFGPSASGKPSAYVSGKPTFFSPSPNPAERTLAQVEGWILGVV